MNKFPWIFTLLWLIILIIMLSAGFWQLGRAEEKQQIQDRVKAGLSNQPISLNDWKQLEAFDQVEIKGQYHNSHFLLDNQIMNGQVGYFVFSSFQTSEGVWLLVNRGWTDKDEQDFDITGETQNLKALLADWPRPGVQLGEQVVENIHQQHVTYLQQEPVMALLKQRHCQQNTTQDCIILSRVLKLQPTALNGFNRDWQLPRMTVEKHQGYALQWFLMSLVLCIIYIIFMFKNYATKN